MFIFFDNFSFYFRIKGDIEWKLVLWEQFMIRLLRLMFFLNFIIFKNKIGNKFLNKKWIKVIV